MVPKLFANRGLSFVHEMAGDLSKFASRTFIPSNRTAQQFSQAMSGYKKAGLDRLRDIEKHADDAFSYTSNSLKKQGINVDPREIRMDMDKIGNNAFKKVGMNKEELVRSMSDIMGKSDRYSGINDIMRRNIAKKTMENNAIREEAIRKLQASGAKYNYTTVGSMVGAFGKAGVNYLTQGGVGSMAVKGGLLGGAGYLATRDRGYY